MDGAVVNHSPISHAIALGVDEVWVLPTGYSCALTAVPRSAVGIAMHALTVLVQHRLALDVERYEAEVAPHVIPPPCPVTGSSIDFSRTGQLIDDAHDPATRWLTSGRIRPSEGQAALLEPHQHLPLPHHEPLVDARLTAGRRGAPRW